MQTTKRAAELKGLAELVARIAAYPASDYRPTITDPAQADAFDAAMASIGNPTRAWRGSVTEKKRGATKGQLQYRAARFLRPSGMVRDLISPAGVR